ncbi:Altered inheritance of mitochondria protein 6 [Pichia californica]|uniref:Altered inheritance of mitochondria protein 6 n=1 Tax=Pichia californica TaxID=460514 RepID=A0A9P6WKR1_9ASCO|nr:Altered inheritance of mitochondria protein 6 [[Candida] californica]KAG0688812.1 Altered inheritance of mitochondria protein 6 [[Candida] californica]
MKNSANFYNTLNFPDKEDISNNIIELDIIREDNKPKPIKLEIKQLPSKIQPFSLSIIIMVSVLSTLITLIFTQTIMAIPIRANKNNMHHLTEEIDKLSLLNFGKEQVYFQNHNDLLKHLTDDFYTVKGITHDVFVKGIHSHNDYWRNRPLLDALSLGVQSVEADIWYFPENENDCIYVGHSKRSLKNNRLLESLYLDQLYAILEGSNNISNDTIINDSSQQYHPAGVWDTDSSKTLYFFIDFKTDGEELFDVFSEKLNRFRDQNWLSYYNTTEGEFHWGPITVIGTGNTPLNKVLNQGKIRDIFFDGPLNQLGDEDVNDIYSLGVSPIVSSSLKNLVGNYISSSEGLSEAQIAIVTKRIDAAHNLGIKTRIWDTPWWPISEKYKIWHQMIEMGSDYLNADDLVTAASFRV